jgi:hypothetical protein
MATAIHALTPPNMGGGTKGGGGEGKLFSNPPPEISPSSSY